MIPIEEAEQILDNITFHPETEIIPLTETLGRVLGQDIISTINMPPFDKSAMDGYALKKDDDSKRFKVVEVIAAGSVPTKKIEKGHCAGIMTGAMLPEGADRVIKVEVTQEKDGYMTITGVDNNTNICYLGEDVKPGDTILKSGHLIRPQEVGIIASMGRKDVSVYKKPLLGIVTTGSEIIEPGNPLQTGQIYNSNAYSISAQVLQSGARIKYAGIASDDKEIIRNKIGNLLEETQFVLISGGVSEGTFDFVPYILKDLGVKLFFDRVAIQPGKPTVFGRRENTLVFGMPGNPVSTFIVFEVLVKPVLYRSMGYVYQPRITKGVMAKEFKRKRTVRTAYVPVKLNRENEVEPVEYHGSAHLSALANANALLKIPRGQKIISKGTTVYVRQI